MSLADKSKLGFRPALRDAIILIFDIYILNLPRSGVADPGKQNILVPGGKENKVISLVAASETEKAQTRPKSYGGFIFRAI